MNVIIENCSIFICLVEQSRTEAERLKDEKKIEFCNGMELALSVIAELAKSYEKEQRTESRRIKDENKDRIEHELKTCRILESSWRKRAEQFCNKENHDFRMGAENRSAVYGIMAERLQKILNEWKEERG